MSFKVSDYARVDDLAIRFGCNCPTGICILPENFETASKVEDFIYRSEAATVKTLFRLNKISIDLLGDQGAGYIQNNSFDWVAPTIFISATVISNDPNIVSIGISVLANYITDALKGFSGSKRVKLSVVVEKKGGKEFKKISYEGDVDGMDKLMEIIKEVTTD